MGSARSTVVGVMEECISYGEQALLIYGNRRVVTLRVTSDRRVFQDVRLEVIEGVLITVKRSWNCWYWWSPTEVVSRLALLLDRFCYHGLILCLLCCRTHSSPARVSSIALAAARGKTNRLIWSTLPLSRVRCRVRCNELVRGGAYDTRRACMVCMESSG